MLPYIKDVYAEFESSDKKLPTGILNMTYAIIY